MNYEPAPQFTVVNAFSILLRHLRLFAVLFGLAMAFAFATWYVRGREYVSESRFRPSASKTQNMRLAGLAAQFGLGGSLPNEDESIDFYAELVKSRSLLEQVATTPIDNTDRQRDQTYIQLNHIKGDDQRQTLQKAVSRLKKKIAVSTNPKAGTVTVRVHSRWPLVAEQLNGMLLDDINKFNLEKRQSKGAAERRFVQQRLAEAQVSLRKAEEALEEFQERNRRFGAAPDLKLAAARLERRVDLEQQVYLSLAQEFEKARIEEVRDIPVITVIDLPTGSARRSGSLPRTLVFSAVPGLLLALAGVFAADYLQRLRRQRPHDFEELGAARRDVLRSLQGRRANP